EKVLQLERQVAAAKVEEYAEPCGFPLQWDVGAPMPHLMTNDHRALLAFFLSRDPDWIREVVDWTVKGLPDGSCATGGRLPEDQPIALVEFDGCVSARLGTPNEEVFAGHPLYGKGMKGYTAQRVVNSRWLKELEAINSIHSCYSPEYWREQNHFVFWFHD